MHACALRICLGCLQDLTSVGALLWRLAYHSILVQLTQFLFQWIEGMARKRMIPSLHSWHFCRALKMAGDLACHVFVKMPGHDLTCDLEYDLVQMSFQQLVNTLTLHTSFK